MNVYNIRICLIFALSLSMLWPSCLLKKKGFINKKPRRSKCFTKDEIERIHSHYLRNINTDQRIYFELRPYIISESNPCIGIFSYQRRGENDGGLDIIHPVLAFNERIECYISDVQARDSIWQAFYRSYGNSFSEAQIAKMNSFFNIMGATLGGADLLD
ncbi:MAG: hypothetical protein AAFR61_32290 [Bacteroidota bacterium]